jgi:hypothetical protein
MKNFANIEKNQINTKMLRSRKIVSNENTQITQNQNTKQNQIKKNLNLQNQNKEEIRKFGKDIKYYIENLKLPKNKNNSILYTQRIQIEKNYEENEKFKVFLNKKFYIVCFFSLIF